MKKRIIRILSVIFIMAMMNVNVVLADDFVDREENVSNIVDPRSRYLAGAISEITNEGSGVLGIYADFTSYNSVDWARITINLERKKDASSTSWTHVKTYTYEFDVADEPDGRLTSGTVEFEARGLATDYYYRLRCEHKVKTPSGSYESKNTQTDGVLLTSYPVYRSIDANKQDINMPCL